MENNDNNNNNNNIRNRHQPLTLNPMPVPPPPLQQRQANYFTLRNFFDALHQASPALVLEFVAKHPTWVNQTYRSESALARCVQSDRPQDAVLQVVQILLNHGANINAQDPKGGDTALIHAVRMNRFALVLLLLERGADVTIATNSGSTPLLLAVDKWACSFDIIELLVRHAATNSTTTTTTTTAAALINVVNKPNRAGETPFSIAMARKNTAAVHLLVQHGANVNACTKLNETPLFRAISCWKDQPVQQLQVLQLLLDHGANVHAQDDKFKDTALMRAVYLNCVPAIELLVRYGARVNTPNVLSDTPFYRACRIGDVGIIYALIRSSPQYWFQLNEFLQEEDDEDGDK